MSLVAPVVVAVAAAIAAMGRCGVPCIRDVTCRCCSACVAVVASAMDP